MVSSVDEASNRARFSYDDALCYRSILNPRMASISIVKAIKHAMSKVSVVLDKKSMGTRYVQVRLQEREFATGGGK